MSIKERLVVRHFVPLPRDESDSRNSTQSCRNSWSWDMLKSFPPLISRSHQHLHSTCQCMPCTRPLVLPQGESSLCKVLKRLLVGPTMHPKLIDVLLRFQMHPVALTADILKMYRAVELVDDDKDFHRFVWRSNPKSRLVDYRLTRVIFGVSASSLAANMAVKQQNAIHYSLDYPEAAEVMHKSRYIDDSLTGAEDPESALTL